MAFGLYSMVERFTTGAKQSLNEANAALVAGRQEDANQAKAKQQMNLQAAQLLAGMLGSHFGAPFAIGRAFNGGLEKGLQG